MSAHAPGPWIFSEGWRGIYDADDRAVVVVCGPAVVRTNEQRERQRISEANARLIAAAPELLGALKEMRTALALAMRVIAEHELSDEWIALLREAGVTDGIGVRSQAAIHAAEGK